ncbi:MAG: helicase-related protein [Polyangiales bacterium]
MLEASSVQALLGPTNTGKTHRAMERMLEHPTGMIGLPLRLLAREVYDRLTAKVGEARVALITGEERRAPKRPDYWVCTVEAMPVSREVDFVAVDEVQLAAHDQRGHVFTDRVLHARGRRETWFLGSDSMRGFFSEHVPVARVTTHPRLSRLRYAGPSTLARVPPRSAIVAFSMSQVYEIAERLRAIRGGCAVVLGALSPRTRNAQVAMYQSGEVDYLVATDAIGMGLNLDVRHVAFAALRKFDGRDTRAVGLAELAQIAGRAGRYVQDGTFGTLSPLSLPLELSDAIEAHLTDPVRRVYWRRHELDFSDLDALNASLLEPPRQRGFARVTDADDAKALAHLGQRPEVRALLRGPDDVRRLWDVCSVPDFRKLLFEAHADMLAAVFLALGDGASPLSDDWLDERVSPLDSDQGDVETLVARIASVRTWTFIANRAGWVRDPTHWQERTRAIEDSLSDALHQRLVLRFVDEVGARRPVAAPTPRRAPAQEPAEAPRGHPFAALAAMRARLSPAAREPSPRDDGWIESLIDAEHRALSVDASGRVRFRERVVARIIPGADITRPDARLLDLDELPAGARTRALRRLVAYARDLAGSVVGPLQRELPSDARGLAWRLAQRLGSAPREEVAELVDALDPAAREALTSIGVVLGARAVFLPSSLRPEALRARAALAGVFHGGVVELPPGRVALRAPPRADANTLRAMGFLRVAGFVVRADLVERIASAPSPLDVREAATWLGLPLAGARQVLGALRGVPPEAP